jgi:hypothetical protein
VADRQSGAAASARGNRAALPTGAARTPGVALSYLHEARVLFVEFFLSTIEIVENGLSPFEDWVQILKGAMNDVSQQAVLRLDFGPVTPERSRACDRKRSWSPPISRSRFVRAPDRKSRFGRKSNPVVTNGGPPSTTDAKYQQCP